MSWGARLCPWGGLHLRCELWPDRGHHTACALATTYGPVRGSSGTLSAQVYSEGTRPSWWRPSEPHLLKAARHKANGFCAIPILQTRKLRPKGAEEPVWGHVASEWWGPDANSCRLLEPGLEAQPRARWSSRCKDTVKPHSLDSRCHPGRVGRGAWPLPTRQLLRAEGGTCGWKHIDKMARPFLKTSRQNQMNI